MTVVAKHSLHVKLCTQSVNTGKDLDIHLPVQLWYISTTLLIQTAVTAEELIGTGRHIGTSHFFSYPLFKPVKFELLTEYNIVSWPCSVQVSANNGKKLGIEMFYILIKLNLYSHYKVALAVDRKLIFWSYLLTQYLNYCCCCCYCKSCNVDVVCFLPTALFINLLSTGHLGTDDLSLITGLMHKTENKCFRTRKKPQWLTYSSNVPHILFHCAPCTGHTETLNLSWANRWSGFAVIWEDFILLH